MVSRRGYAANPLVLLTFVAILGFPAPFSPEFDPTYDPPRGAILPRQDWRYRSPSAPALARGLFNGSVAQKEPQEPVPEVQIGIPVQEPWTPNHFVIYGAAIHRRKACSTCIPEPYKSMPVSLWDCRYLHPPHLPGAFHMRVVEVFLIAVPNPACFRTACCF